MQTTKRNWGGPFSYATAIHRILKIRTENAATFYVNVVRPEPIGGTIIRAPLSFHQVSRCHFHDFYVFLKADYNRKIQLWRA